MGIVRVRALALVAMAARTGSAWAQERVQEVVALERSETAPDLPPGTTACQMGAWSEDTDKAGLNVRAGPTFKAKVLGTLPPPFTFKGASEAVPDAGYRTEFRIIGFRDGWFLIEGAKPPGRRYFDRIGTAPGDYPPRHPKAYSGRGWVSATKVGAQFANGRTRMGGLFAEPSENAAWTPALNEGGWRAEAHPRMQGPLGQGREP